MTYGKKINPVRFMMFASVAFSLTIGCAAPATHTSLRGRAYQESRPPSKPTPTRRSQVKPEYRLGFGDVIEVKFFYNDQFNETVTVRPDGRISLQQIGEVQVSGKTPSQLDAVITEAYEKFVVEPAVTVILREFGGYQFYVLGEVQAPGGYPIQRNMTALQAIAAAGGAKASAKFGSVMILRRGDDDEMEAIKVNLAASVKGKRGRATAARSIAIQPQDVIYVPKTFIASAADFLSQVYAGFLPPVDLYLRSTLFYK